ncbi:hypothetical protein Tco_0646801 [Tanacetum coccineum]
MARSLASERVGFGTQSLLEQWRDSYGNGDYDEDPYDDDMYEENRPPMLNKYNYVPWPSRLLRYAKSKPNEKLLENFILHSPYVRRMIIEPDDPDRQPPVAESTHEQSNDELTDKEAKQVEADDQAIQTILMGLPKDIYAAVDNCNTTQEIWLRV